jgi:hypothetical protein
MQSGTCVFSEGDMTRRKVFAAVGVLSAVLAVPAARLAGDGLAA